VRRVSTLFFPLQQKKIKKKSKKFFISKKDVSLHPFFERVKSTKI
jgi:hypothetical protein